METKIENVFLTKRQQLLLLKMSLFLGIDVLFAILSTTFLVDNKQIISGYVPYMLIVFLTLFSLLAVWIKKEDTYPIMLYGCLFVMFAAGYIVLNLSWWIIAAILLFLHWKFSSYFESEDEHIEMESGVILLFLCMSAFSLIIGNVRDLENKYVVLSVIVLLFFLSATLTSVQRMLQGQIGHKGRNSKNLIKPFGIMLIVLAGGGIFTYFSSFVRLGVYWVLNKLFWLFSFLVDPIFALLVKVRDWILSRMSSETLEGFGMKLNEKVDTSQQEAFYDGMSVPWLNELLIGIFIAAIIIYFVMKRKVSYGAIREEAPATIMTKFINTGTQKMDNKTAGILYTDAENAIRQAIRELEREAASINKGREDSENIRTWFTRIGIHEEDSFFILYESVRYGTRIPEKQDVAAFTQKVDNHISVLKGQHDKE